MPIKIDKFWYFAYILNKYMIIVDPKNKFTPVEKIAK